MRHTRGAILVVSRNPDLADVRKNVLEKAEFTVFAASDILAVKRECAERKPDVVMIGYSLPPSEKRRVWHEIRRCGLTIPVLELHENGKPELMDSTATFFHASKTPDDFLAAIEQIVEQRKKERKPL